MERKVEDLCNIDFFSFQRRQLFRGKDTMQ